MELGKLIRSGVEKKEIRIELINDRILSYAIDLNELTRVLQQSSFLTSAGKITDAGLRYNVRPNGELRNVEDIEELIIGENNLKVKDIAVVKYIGTCAKLCTAFRSKICHRAGYRKRVIR